MFNSGLRGNRAPDGYGTVSSQAQFVQSKYPIPSITTFQVCNIGQYTPNGDTAADTAGNQTIVLLGSGFVNGCTLILDTATISPVTFLSDDKIAFTSPAKASGSYAIYVSNPNGGTAILAPGLIYSGTPTFTTPAGSIGSYYETQSISNTIVATSDSAITYSISSGALPNGATLYANGVISGTAPVENNSNTYSFTIQATDAESQDAFRSFNLTINADVVTWSSPADGTTYTYPATSPISNVTLSATSAAGYNVSYTANALPANVTLNGNVISGTPNTVANTTTLLTATAATTGRTATRTINWVITVANDVYFPYTSLLLTGSAPTSTWIQDASTNKFALTINGDSKPAGLSPYLINFSNFFDGTGDYLTIPNGSNTALGSGDFTVEVWLYATAVADSRTAFSVGPTTGAIAMALYFAGTTNWQLSMYTPAGSVSFTSTAATTASYPALNAWCHHAIVRNSGNIYWYVNGVQVYTVANTVNFTQNGATVGFWASTAAWQGYISNFRIVVGTAVYTSAFTPPTSPLTAIANTRFLTCQSNRLVDTSTNNFTITKNGDVTVTGFGPFTETDTTTGSGYFDGSGDYLVTAGSALNTGAGTSDITFECWVYNQGFSGSQYGRGIFAFYPAAGYGSNRLLLRLGSSSNVFNVYFLVTSVQFGASGTSSTGIATPYAWTHVALVRSSQTFRLYINGNLDTTFAATSASLNNFDTLNIARTQDGTVPEFNGYISDFRYVKGSAVYTSNFTPPTQSLSPIANTAILTLQYRLGENSNRIIDNSNNNFVITRNGNTNQGTFSPFSQTGWSNYFDGTGDSLSWSGTVIGSGAFSVEFWIYSTNGYSAMRAPIGVAGIGSTNAFEVRINSATQIQIGKYNVSLTSFTVPTLVANTWYHIVLCRNASNQATVFVNGTRSSTGAISFSLDFPAATSRIGQLDGGANAGEVTGYISNVRIIVGSTPYDPTQSTITVPTSKLTAISNTQLLTCQDNRFKDNSTNNFTITRNNDTSVQAFGPFSPSASYSLTTVGGSGYFDGTGDYLSATANAAFGFGTGNFSVEAWIYRTNTNNHGIYANGGVATGSFAFYVISNNIKIDYYNGTSLTGASTLTTGQWYHVAVAKVGSNISLFLNGSRDATTTTSSNNTSTNCYVGEAWGGSGAPFFGYMSGFRIIKGTSAYDPTSTTITLPTAPPSSTTSTSLLLNFTNSGILDATSKNTLETFGNALISNAQSKWSTTSLYFDGTGDYLSMRPTIMQTLTGALTIEAWVYPIGTGQFTLWGNWNSNQNGYALFLEPGAASRKAFMYYGNYGSNEGWLQATLPITTSAWNHIAVCRDASNNWYFFHNGTSYATSTGGSTWTNSRSFNNTSDPLFVGTSLNGYINDLRLTAGYARYTANFTPPTAPFSTY